MTKENAILKPLSTLPAHRGIHLVHSDAWPGIRPERQPLPVPRSLTMIDRTPTPNVRPIRESRAMATLTLGVAAAAAPLVWIGHAVLHWMHVL
jgi:hypothetical protein